MSVDRTEKPGGHGGDAHGSDGYVAAAAALGLSANFPGVTLATVRQRTRTP